MRTGIDASPMAARRAGVGQYAAKLISHLVRLAPEEEFVLYRTGPWGGSVESAEWGAHVRVVSAPKLLVQTRSRLDRLDVYHGTNYRLRGSGRRGTVLSIHDLAIECTPGLARHDWIARRKSEKTKRTAHQATVVVVGSEHTARDVVEVMGVPREKIKVINYGVGEEYYPERTAGGREALCSGWGRNITPSGLRAVERRSVDGMPCRGIDMSCSSARWSPARTWRHLLLLSASSR